MFRKIKPYKVSVLIIIAWIVAVSLIPRLYYGATEKLMVAEAIEEYEADVESKYEELTQQYERDLAAYQQASANYATDSAAYDEYMTQYEQQYSEWNKRYQAAVQTYNNDLAAYEENLEKYRADYSSAYEKAYSAAEAELLRDGLPFTVSVSRRRDYNHSVGNEWSGYGSINGQTISGKVTMTLQLGETLEFYAKMVENDNVPDVGTSSYRCTVKQDYFESGFIVTQQVIVRENRGRYSGNTASFTYEYKFVPDDYTVVVDESLLPVEPQRPQEPIKDPPVQELQEPVVPIEPNRPTIADVGLEKPDTSRIIVSDTEVLSHFKSAKIIRSLVSICAAVLVVMNIVKTKKRLVQKNDVIEIGKAEYSVVEEEHTKAGTRTRRRMLIPTVVCYIFSGIYALMGFIEGFMLAFASFFGIIGSMFLILAYSPKDIPFILGGTCRLKKRTFVWICIIAAFTVVAVMANVIQP